MMFRLNLCRRLLSLLFLWLFGGVSVAASTEAPKMLLLNSYQAESVVGWLMSEKLDGVRAQWNGRQLISRGGHVISAPAWFLKDFPEFALDGELWTQRQDFENILSIVRKKQPDQRWHEVTYNIFEVPNQVGGLLDRLSVLKAYLKKHPVPHLKVIPQIKIESDIHFRSELKRLVGLGAEGLVLRNPDQGYVTGRHASALKVKPFQEDECQLLGTTPGKGKYLGQVGALVCLWRGEKILIGSGLSDHDREIPPSEGAWITFKYYGVTATGRPRFPVYLRVKADKDF